MPVKITIKLLKPYKDIAGRGEFALNLKKGTARRALKKLCEDVPELRKEVFDEKGEVELSLNIIINDKPVTSIKELDKALKDGDILTLFMAVSGG